MKRARVPLSALVVVAAIAIAACERADPPDARGTVVSIARAGDGVALGFAPDDGYEYFEGTTFTIAPDQGLDVDAVAEGDRIVVWVDACAESFPVQCQVVSARLAEPTETETP